MGIVVNSKAAINRFHVRGGLMVARNLFWSSSWDSATVWDGTVTIQLRLMLVFCAFRNKTPLTGSLKQWEWNISWFWGSLSEIDTDYYFLRRPLDGLPFNVSPVPSWQILVPLEPYLCPHLVFSHVASSSQSARLCLCLLPVFTVSPSYWTVAGSFLTWLPFQRPHFQIQWHSTSR